MSIWSSLFKGHKDEGGATGVLPSPEDWLLRAEDSPHDPLARQQAGDILAMRGETALAVHHWLAAADIYMSQGFAVKAMAVLVHVLQIAPDNDAVRMRIASIARDEDVPLNADLTIRTRLRAWTPLFSDISRADLTDIIKQMKVKQFVGGEVLLRQGEVASALSVLMEGSVRIVLTNARGEEVEIGRLRYGDFFGESSVLLDLPTPASLVSEGPGELLVWPREAFEAISSERPQLRAVLERFHENRAHQAVDAIVAKFQQSA